MIVIHARFRVDSDHRTKATGLIRKLVESLREEDGILEYRVATDIEDPNVFRFFEQYENEAAFEAHPQADHVQASVEAISDLLADEPEVVRFEVESATQLDF